MRIALLAAVPLSLVLLACGDDGGGGGGIDAPSAVVKLSCTGATAAVTVTAPGFAFEPMSATIQAGQIVKFTMPATHNAISDTAGLFNAGFAADNCFRFDAPGSYGYHCEPHGFQGTIIVQ